MTCDFEQSTAKWFANLTVYRQNGLFLDNSNPLRGKSKSNCTWRIKIRRSTLTIRRILKTFGSYRV